MGGPFVSVPHRLLLRSSELGLSSEELVLLLHILAARQVEGAAFLSPQMLGQRTNLPPSRVADLMGRLVTAGLLAIGARFDESGTESNYFDLTPLWRALWPSSGEPVARPSDVVTLFEQEFGRPLSPFECEQIVHWLERDRYPEWMLVEALREAVLANKYNIKYIDRILYHWQRSHIRSRQDLEEHRQQFRERSLAREEAAAAAEPSGGYSRRQAAAARNVKRDERYAAFYELFPDA